MFFGESFITNFYFYSCNVAIGVSACRVNQGEHINTCYLIISIKEKDAFSPLDKDEVHVILIHVDISQG